MAMQRRNKWIGYHTENLWCLAIATNKRKSHPGGAFLAPRMQGQIKGNLSFGHLLEQLSGHGRLNVGTASGITAPRSPRKGAEPTNGHSDRSPTCPLKPQCNGPAALSLGKPPDGLQATNSCMAVSSAVRSSGRPPCPGCQKYHCTYGLRAGPNLRERSSFHAIFMNMTLLPIALRSIGNQSYI